MRLFDLVQQAHGTNILEWNYYHTNIDIDLTANPERAAEFIRDYFRNGEKGLAVVELLEEQAPRQFARKNWSRIEENSVWRPLLSEYRAIHTVSAFFLGLLLKSYLVSDEYELDISTDHNYFPFSYLWFLICLYHDYGYIIEENDKPSQRPSKHANQRSPQFRWVDLARIRSKLGIWITPNRMLYRIHSFHYPRSYRPNVGTGYLLLEQLREKAPNIRNGVTYRNGIQVSWPTYPNKLISNYFSYCMRKLEPAVYDHGIIGGYMFYDRIMKTYLSAYRQAYLHAVIRRGPYPDLIDFTWKKHFCAEQIPIFAHVSDCIIAHNIWKAGDKEAGQYREYGLNDLMNENFQKLSFKRNPLLFILAIVDTLEPYKAYCTPSSPEKSSLSVWKAIDFTFQNGFLTISSYNTHYPIERLYQKAKGLEEWTDITCVGSSDAGNSFQIKLA